MKTYLWDGYIKKTNNVISHIYKVCSKGIQPCNMKKRDIYLRKYKVQETLYIGQ